MVKDLDNSYILEELHQDEAELHRDEKLIKTSFVTIAVFIFVIIGAVSYLVYKSVTEKKAVTTIINNVISEPTGTVAPVISPSLAVSESPSPTPTSIIANTASVQSSGQKDYYINIGYGTNTSTDWVDVAGAITTADIAQYQNIKEVYFEASVNVPTANGTVSVRLYNATDKRPVWNSEITRNGISDTNLYISPSISYETGPKMYQVQMKSQLGVKANLVQSRIHIVTK